MTTQTILEARQEVFDEICERLLVRQSTLTHSAQRKLAMELIQAGWDIGLNTDSLCEDYGESLADANEASL